MNTARGFLVMGSLYLIIGILFGMYMGGKQDFTFAPLHAHINLLGFVLMTVFGILYRLFPAMDGNLLARLHFWLHQIGALVLLILLFLLFSGRVEESAMVPAAPIAELVVLLSVLAYAVNLFRNAR
ncbi:MAG: hypothetical protein N2422_11995 [Rhodobacteraceae bacterium]|nr:hypothetical protein [Paracoccaceae bacterium]